LTRTRS